MESMGSYHEKNESLEKIKPEGIIAGMPGIGKTTLINNCPDGVQILDLDSNPYRKDPNWPDIYLDLIEKSLNENDLVLISSYPEIVKALLARGHEVTVVCADENLVSEYKERFEQRGNKPEMVEKFITSAFAKNEEQEERFLGAKVVFLQSGQYLSDVLDLPE